MHRRHPLRPRPLALGLALVFSTFSPCSAQAQAGAPVPITIPAQPLAQALNDWARQTGLQLIVQQALVQGKTAPAVSGSLPPLQALERLLAGSGLQGALEGSAVVIKPAPPAPPREVGMLQPIRASAARETADGPVLGYVAGRSAAGTKTDTPIIETPQSVSVVGREEMNARGVQDVMDAIRYTPGITTNIYGPDNRGWEDIAIRGFSSYYSGYRDGLAQTPSGVSYYLTEPFGLERVEVLRGPSSMIYGQGDAGGIINRVSKLPTGGRIRDVELQLGAYARKQLAFDVGDQIGSSDLSLRLVGLALDSNDQDRYPDGHELNRQRQYLAPSMRWQPRAGTSLTLFSEFLKHDSPEDTYYLNVNGTYTHLKMGDYSFSLLKHRQAAVGYKFEAEVAEHWSLAHSLRYSHLTIDRRVVWIDSVDDNGHTLHRIARTWNDPLNQLTADTSLRGKLRSGGMEHTVLLGIDWNDQRATARRFIGAAPDLELNAPIYGQPVASPTEPLANYRQTTRQLGFYAQDQIRWAEHWLLTLGGRQDRVKSALDDRLNSSEDPKSDSAFSTRAGLTYLAGNGLAPYLSYAESFLPNSGTDARSKPYQPSRGKQLELGLKYQPADRNALFTAAIFDLRKTNVVTYDPVSFEGRQIGKQRSRGLELEAKGEVLPRLNVSAAYTWLDGRVAQSADPSEIGKQSPGVPRQSASLWADYALTEAWSLGAGLRYIGPRANDEYNTSFVGGDTLMDAALSYAQGPWRVSLNIGNLLNRRYFSICYHGECYAGAERNATVTAKYSF